MSSPHSHFGPAPSCKFLEAWAPPKISERRSMPAAKTSAKAKAAQRKRANATPLAAAPSSALEVVRQEEGKAKNQPPRRLRRRNTDEAIQKCLKDNFAGWEPCQTDNFIVGGRSLREQLTYDRRRANQGDSDAPCMGKFYYDEMRSRYSSNQSPFKRLRVTNDRESLNSDLEAGLAGLNLHIKKYDRIMDFLHTGPEVNQLSLVVLYKHALKISASASGPSVLFLLAVLKYVGRHNLNTKYPTEFDLLKGHLDAALVSSWRSFQSRGLVAKTWWLGVRDSAKLILPEQQTQILINLAAGAEWSSVESELAFVVQCSAIGERLFGAAFNKLLRGKMSGLIKAKVDELVGAPITVESVEKNRVEFLAAVRARGRDPMEAMPLRDVDMRYRNTLLTLQCGSVYDEYLVNVATVTHGIAVDMRVMKPLFCEDYLVKQDRVVPEKAIDEAVVAASIAARDAAVEAMSNKSQSAEVILETLEANRAVFCQLDRFWRVEEAFFKSVSGNNAETRLREEILCCLPSLEDSMTTDESIRKMDRLGVSKLLEFVGIGLQSVFRSVRQIVAAIDAGAAPSYDRENSSDFMKDIMERVACFCVFDMPASAEQTPTVIRGRPAALKLHEKMKGARLANNGKLTLKQMEPLVPFQWLLTDVAIAEMKVWADEAVQADMVASATAAVAKGRGKGGKGGRKKTSADARKKVLDCLK